MYSIQGAAEKYPLKFLMFSQQWLKISLRSFTELLTHQVIQLNKCIGPPREGRDETYVGGCAAAKMGQSDNSN